MLWSSLGLSLLVLVAGAFLVPAPLAARGAARDPRRRDLRQRAARVRGGDRRGGRRAGDGAAARAARPRRLVPPDRAQRPPERRLDDLRGARHRHRRAGARARAALGLEARGRGGGDDPRARRADRVRPRVGEALRALGRPRLARVPDLVDAPRREPRRSLVAARDRAGSASGRESTWWWRCRSRGSRSPPTTRASRGAAAARSGELRSATSSRTCGCTRSARSCCSRAGWRTRPPSITAIAAGGLGAALALVALGIDETKEPFANIYSAAVSLQNVVPRVPQRLLILAVAAVATAGSVRRSTSSTTRASSTCSARSSCRSSACCSRSGSRASATRSPRRSSARDRSRVARRVLPLPVARAGRAELLDPASSITPTRARERSAARCRASPSPSSCRSALRLRVVRPLAVIGPSIA